MAGKESTLSIIIRAVNKTTAEMRKATSDIRKFGADVAKVGKSLSTHLTLPIVAAGAASVSAFAKFEQGMSNVSTLIDTNTESLAEMSRETLAIGRETPVALDDLTSALYDIRSAGVAASDQFTVLRNAAQLGVAGLGTTKEATDLVTSSLNAFQLEGEEAARVYDTIFKVVKFGKTNIAEMSQGFGAVAGTVANSGTKLDEYLAALAAMTTVGLPASVAHTQLRKVIVALSKDTEQTSAVFKSLGAKDLPDLIQQSGGLVPALERISKKLKGNTANMLDLLGTSEALNAMLSLTGAQNEAYKTTLDSMRNGANAVTEAFEKQNNTMQAQSQRTKNALAAAGVAVGAVLAPAMEKLASSISSAADWLASLDKSTQSWIVGIAAVVAAIGPALILIGQMATGIAALKTAIVVLKLNTLVTMIGSSLVVALKALSATLLTTPIGWVLLGITALIAVGYLLVTNWDKVKLFLESMWEVVQEAFSVFLDWVNFAFLNFTPLGLVIKHWGPITDFFSSLWDGVVLVFEAAWQKIQDIVDGITGVVDTVTGAVDSVVGAVGDVGSSIGSFFGGDDDGAPGRGGPQAPPLGADAFGRMAAEGNRSSTSVRIEFANAPRGTRVDSSGSGPADVDLAVGYQLGGL